MAGLSIPCPKCKKPLNISTSERPSLISVTAKVVCCNPRCEGFRADFLGEMVNFQTATFRPAPEIATWTKAEVDMKHHDENQLAFSLNE